MHSGAWRHPATELSNIFAPERYEHIARVLEAARFDGCFYADTLGLPDIYKGSYDTYLHYGGQISYLDPLTIPPLLAPLPHHLGVAAPLSTPFHHPHLPARLPAAPDPLPPGPPRLQPCPPPAH